MPGVDSNGLQTRNSTESHNFWIEKNADHFVLGASALHEVLLMLLIQIYQVMKKSQEGT